MTFLSVNKNLLLDERQIHWTILLVVVNFNMHFQLNCKNDILLLKGFYNYLTFWKTIRIKNVYINFSKRQYRCNLLVILLFVMTIRQGRKYFSLYESIHFCMKISPLFMYLCQIWICSIRASYLLFTHTCCSFPLSWGVSNSLLQTMSYLDTNKDLPHTYRYCYFQL